MPRYTSLRFDSTFLETFGEFSKRDQRRFLQAMRLLDTNDQHPSLRVHQLHGDKAGQWSASASDELRMTFNREADGTKMMLECNKHYND